MNNLGGATTTRSGDCMPKMYLGPAKCTTQRIAQFASPCEKARALRLEALRAIADGVRVRPKWLFDVQEALELTQEEFAEVLGIPKRTLQWQQANDQPSRVTYMRSVALLEHVGVDSRGKLRAAPKAVGE